MDRLNRDLRHAYNVSSRMWRAVVDDAFVNRTEAKLMLKMRPHWVEDT